MRISDWSSDVCSSDLEVLAVLDWELSTIGHPLADLAYFCLPYYLPADDLRGLRGECPESLGLPSEDEIKAVYCRATGRSDLPDWRYMIVSSEEHTSELQSLMRISYAVFCLKHKKQLMNL